MKIQSWVAAQFIVPIDVLIEVVNSFVFLSNLLIIVIPQINYCVNKLNSSKLFLWLC